MPHHWKFKSNMHDMSSDQSHKHLTLFWPWPCIFLRPFSFFFISILHLIRSDTYAVISNLCVLGFQTIGGGSLLCCVCACVFFVSITNVGRYISNRDKGLISKCSSRHEISLQDTKRKKGF